MKNYRGNKGFTLIELIVVIAIIGILAVAIVPNIFNNIAKANMAAARSNGKSVLDACNIVSVDVEAGIAEGLNAATVYSSSKLTIIEGTASIDDSVVVEIIANRVVTIWSMVRGQLAMWTEDRNWVIGAENINYIEEEALELSFALSNDNTSYIVKDGRSFTKASLNIPASYKGLPVVGISNNAFNSSATLTNITFPSSITFIGTSTFNGCTGLTNISIPSSVVYIGNSAFIGCSNLTSVTVTRSVGDGITIGGTNMFQNCPDLIIVHVPSNSVAAYKTANGWNKYANNIVGN